MPVIAQLRSRLLLVVLLAPLAVACRGTEPIRSEAEILYTQGKYAEALPLLRQEVEKERSGPRLYQLGFTIERVEGSGDDRRRLWEEARPLLEQEIASPEGATLERFYYLAVIYLNEGDSDGMSRFARRAIDEIEKGPDVSALDGESWFRLARLHDFLLEASEAEAAYRRAVSSFRKAPAVNPAYQGLALAQVADLDFMHLRYRGAAEGYDQALELFPDSTQIKAYRHGLSLLAIDRFEDAKTRFRADRDPETVTEAQYAFDLARKAEEVAPLNEEDFDGRAFAAMPLSSLEDRLREAGAQFRAARSKHSYQTGDPLTAELALRQARFITLLREHLIRHGKIQEFCLENDLAELVRR